MTVLFKPILALHIINFSSCRNYWGGGGKTICLPPPNIFIGGRLAPQPPQDRRLCLHFPSYIIIIILQSWQHGNHGINGRSKDWRKWEIIPCYHISITFISHENDSYVLNVLRMVVRFTMQRYFDLWRNKIQKEQICFRITTNHLEIFFYAWQYGKDNGLYDHKIVTNFLSLLKLSYFIDIDELINSINLISLIIDRPTIPNAMLINLWTFFVFSASEINEYHENTN